MSWIDDRDLYIASDGSRWSIRNVSPPVPTRAFDWEWVSEDYDGAIDAYDDRSGNTSTREKAIEEVEAKVREMAEEAADESS